MATLTEIANLALTELKVAKKIIDISLDGPIENELRSSYPLVRDAVLRAHPWNCAVRRASLPSVGTPPAFGPANAYNLPADPWCLRVLEIIDPATNKPADEDWEVEGRQLLTDWPAPAKVRFIARVGEDQFDALLVECIAKRLAHKVCGALGNSTARKTELWAEYKLLMPEARSVNAMESGPDAEEISSIESVRA